MKNVVELKLIANWLGHPPGSIVKVGNRQATLMIGRGVAIKNEGGNENNGDKEITKKENFSSSVQTNKEEKVVKIQKRNIDKMVKSSINKNI